MTTVSFPPTTVSVSGAVTQVEQQEQKILVVSQKTGSGTAVSGDLNENIQSNANTLAGLTSIGAAVTRAVRALNQDTQLDAIFLDDNGSGVASTGTVTFTGPATEDGSLTFIIGSERNHTLTVAVSDTDTETSIAAALVNAVTADTTILVTAGNVAGVVTLTATNDGTAANDIPIEVRGSVAGVGVTLVGMSGGSADPVLTGVFDVIGETRYQTIIWSWADSLTELTTFVDGRFNVTDDILDGLGYVGKSDTLGNHQTTLGGLNSFINYTAQKKEDTATLKGPALVESPFISAAYAGALRALKLTPGASIGSLNSGESGLDGIGGPALASRPLANTPVFELIPIKVGRGWKKSEITSINSLGGSVIGNNRSGNQVVLGEQLTTRTSSGGSPDNSFKFVNFFDTSVNIREFYVNNLRARFSQSRMTDGSPVPGRPMVNKRRFDATLTEFYNTLSKQDFALTRSGEENRLFFVNNLVSSLNLTTGIATFSVKSPIVVQLRGINGAIEIVFATTEATIEI